MSDRYPPADWLDPLLRSDRSRLVAWMRRWLGCLAAAEDAVQDAALGVLSAGAAPPDHPRAYFARAVQHRAADRLRVARSRQEAPLADAAGLPADTPDPEHAAHARAELARLDRALAALPARQREVLLMHRIEGLSHEAIAARLGCAPATATVHLSRALATLRRRLADG